jgi:3-oxoacyl-[acyl-carrier protein] reductase
MKEFGCMKIELAHKVALVTGGSRGIGAAIVKILAEAGADIAFTYITHTKQAKEMKQRVNTLGRQCLALKTLVSDRKQIRQTVKEIMHTFGRIDILVNNAGIWTYGALGEMTERQWDETMNVNLKSMFLFCNEVVPIMKKQGGGKIINIASSAGQRGEPYHSHYAASKGGVIAFTKSIGPELVPYNIIVNCVSPGWVETDMITEELRKPGVSEEIRRSIPRGRVATPDEIAGSVLFLASELSSHLIGSIMSVNGGAVLSN